ncbi:hypothetical protein ALC56_12222 [Trachymyrmex septentrionalis]|uniref:Uncharacterized protein n=1 Tax=Trachymyrmex septentrionalis TaxID=34720 RepID=A0A195EYY4_9HYME|nr:hypothetical protein ALC56_12222 [Trachymyrmex septentrionalis]
MRALGRALFAVNTFPYRATAARETRRRVEEGGGKKKTPPREGRGAHSRRHPFAKLLTTGNASGAEGRKEGRKERKKERKKKKRGKNAREQRADEGWAGERGREHRNKNKLLFEGLKESAVLHIVAHGRAVRKWRAWQRENAGCWPLHLAYIFTMEANPEVKRGARTFAYGPVAPPFPPRDDTKLYTQSMGRDTGKKITKYGTLLPEFIVRHFAARLVVLVGAERANFARKSTRAKERIRGSPRSRNDSGDLRPWVHEGGRDVKKEGRREGDRSRWWRWTRRTSRRMRWWRRTKRHGSRRDTGGERREAEERKMERVLDKEEDGRRRRRRRRRRRGRRRRRRGRRRGG